VSALFGYDFFFSYAHDYGIEYPEALSKALEAEPYWYKTHLDRREYHVGNDLGLLTRLRVRNSQKLVKIARRAALTDSAWVRREVDVFAAIVGARLSQSGEVSVEEWFTETGARMLEPLR
jgi:hypothetical protein